MLYVIIMVINFIYGTIFSSFYNLVGYRVPLGESIVKPGSHCGNCKHELSAKDLVPVLSCLILDGKCRYCKVSYGKEHALVEFLMGVLFALSSLLIFENIYMYVAMLLFISVYNLNRVSFVIHNKFLIKISGILFVIYILLSFLSGNFIFLFYMILNTLLLFVMIYKGNNKKLNISLVEIYIFLNVILVILFLKLGV